MTADLVWPHNHRKLKQHEMAWGVKPFAAGKLCSQIPYVCSPA